MRIKPILFNTDMVLAILENRKTVTRRICKDGNDLVVPDMGFYDDKKRTYAVHNYADKEHTEKLSIVERTCPICPGDILYVRETWAEWTGGYLYKAWVSPFAQPGRSPIMTWHPSIHMPKEAARIWLKVTGVKVERLQDISPEQMRSEGMIINYLPKELKSQFNKLGAIFDIEEKKKEFCDLWNSTLTKTDLNKYGWSTNPWVWVIEFEQCEKPKSRDLANS